MARRCRVWRNTLYASRQGTNTPIATSDGWQVLKVEGKRKFKVPSFEESKQQLANAVYTKERTEYVQKLVNAAKVD